MLPLDQWDLVRLKVRHVLGRFCSRARDSHSFHNSNIVMGTLCSRCGHYIFILWFLLLFFPRVILVVGDFYTWCGLSANLECRCEMTCAACCSLEMQDPKKSPKIGHLGTITQLCWAISSQVSHVSTIGKKLVKQQYISPHVLTIWWTLAR